MVTVFLFSVVLTTLGLAGAVAEQRRFNARRQTALAAVSTMNVPLVPTPIEPSWMIEGEPVTEAAEIARTDDGTTCVYLWQTTRAHYRWRHQSDEIVVVLAGEVFLADEHRADAAERRLGPGDVAYFPAGTTTVWRVPDRLRKVSTLTRPLPGPAASVMRWLRLIKRWSRHPVPGRVAGITRRHGLSNVQR